jgi:hypothetical protein
MGRVKRTLLNTRARMARVVFRPPSDVGPSSGGSMKTFVIVVFCALVFGHVAYTIFLTSQLYQMRADMTLVAQQQNEQQKQAIAAALDKFRADLGGVLKTLDQDIYDTRMLAAMASVNVVGCDGSKFEAGTLGAAAYRAYARTGVCDAQPSKNVRDSILHDRWRKANGE